MQNERDLKQNDAILTARNYSLFGGVRKPVEHLFSFPVFGHPWQRAVYKGLGRINYATESAMCKNYGIEIFISFNNKYF